MATQKNKEQRKNQLLPKKHIMVAGLPMPDETVKAPKFIWIAESYPSLKSDPKKYRNNGDNS